MVVNNILKVESGIDLKNKRVEGKIDFDNTDYEM